MICVRGMLYYPHGNRSSHLLERSFPPVCGKTARLVLDRRHHHARARGGRPHLRPSHHGHIRDSGGCSPRHPRIAPAAFTLLRGKRPRHHDRRHPLPFRVPRIVLDPARRGPRQDDREVPQDIHALHHHLYRGDRP